MVEVPLERPERFGTRLMLTDAEFKELQQTIAQQRALAVKDFDVTNPSPELQALGDFGDGTSPPPHWLERGEPSRQSSLIVLPVILKLIRRKAEAPAVDQLRRTSAA